MLVFRKALKEDVEAVACIYERVHDAEAAGITTTCWDKNIYPLKGTAEAACNRGDLYVCEDDGAIVATAIINQLQVDVYEGANWQYPATDDEVLVLHTLAVDPTHHKKGIGAAFVRYYEELAREMNCPVLRMDTNAKNIIARKFYPKLGYREADIVPTVFNGIPNVDLVLLEKKL